MQNLLDYEKILNSRHYKDDYTPPAESVIFSIEGNTVGTLGNFSAFTGLPKAGKSTFVNALISSAYALTGESFGMKLAPIAGRPMIGYFDTESAEFDFYKNITRIKRMAGRENLPFFNAFTMRQDSSVIIMELIEFYCKSYPASIVIIDGLLDLMINYNDERESKNLIDWLKRLTNVYNIFILGIIHTGKKDGHTLGHFGSMIDRYSQSVLEIVYDQENKLYRMKPKFLRSSGVFDEIAIQFTGADYARVMFPPEMKKK